jgi:hypothetical protein
VDPEEIAALAVLAELGRTPGSEDTRVTSAEDEVEDVLRRLDLEAVGLLAYALEPEPPSAATREALLARLSGDSTQEVSPVETARPELDLEPIDLGPETEPAAVAPETVPPPAPARPVPAAAAPAVRPAPSAASAYPERAAASRRRSRGGLLAAMFALAALGLGGWAAWLSSELASSRGRVARLESELTRVTRERSEERATLAARVAELEQRAEFASGPASVVFTLRPPAGSSQPLARGKLWVAADHQHWQLDVAGLQPTPAGREYQIWFMVDSFPFSGGSFAIEDVRIGGRVDARMPAGTQGVTVTLERAGGAPRPTSPVLLAADEAVEL